MTMRLMQIHVPNERCDWLAEQLDTLQVVGRWQDSGDEQRQVVHVLARAEQTEAVMDLLEEQLDDEEDLRVLLFAVEAVLPRPQVDDQPEDDADPAEKVIASGRVSREELYGDLSDSLGLTRVYLATTSLSALVAAIGLLRDDVAVIIGAMVIAPLLGPLVALSLASILGDLQLLRRALITGGSGVALAFALAALIGLLVPVDAQIEAIARRSSLSISDIALALAAGAAGAFAFTRGISAALIGVMVAVALMPPLVAAGLQLGAGLYTEGAGALALCAVNIACVNLAGVGTFLAQGIRPRTWWEEERAKSAVRWSSALNLSVLLALIALLYYLPG